MQTLQEKFDEARKQIRGPVEAAARRLFSTPDGKKVLDALSMVFEESTVARDHNGAVDTGGTLVNVGASEVIRYLRELAEIKEEDRA